MSQLEVTEGTIIDLYGLENYVVAAKDPIYVPKPVTSSTYPMISSKRIEHLQIQKHSVTTISIQTHGIFEESSFIVKASSNFRTCIAQNKFKASSPKSMRHNSP